MRFNVKQINKDEGKVQCQLKISNRFAVLENVDDTVDITYGLGIYVLE
jgi:hypothetical protein